MTGGRIAIEQEQKAIAHFHTVWRNWLSYWFTGIVVDLSRSELLAAWKN